MRFLIDAMLPPGVADRLNAAGHDAVTPVQRGGHDVDDGELVEVATAEGRVIVTENARDFADATACAVLLVRKSWWPAGGLAARLADALGRWAAAHPEPGPWPVWMETAVR